MREVYKNVNGTYDSEKCKYKEYIVNTIAKARYLCYDGGFKCQVEQDTDYDYPRFIFFFPSSVELEEFASHYNEFLDKKNKKKSK